MLILKPSKKKIIASSFLFLILACICYFIEPLSNKITFGTHIIGVYESTLFYLLATYYLLQLIPGYAKLTIDENGFSEIWFFRQRINISWLTVDIEKSLQTKTGDIIYINSLNEQLFSRKIAFKGTYSLADKVIYQKFLELLKSTNLQKSKVNKNCYLLLSKTKSSLLITFTLIVIAFNSYYLMNEKPDQAFIEQISYWQQQGNTDQQLFELFKVYGFYWKSQLKQFDRKLFYRILLQESQQIEALILKRKQSLSEIKKSQIKQLLSDCKDKFLYYDETMYLKCLEKI